ncbi:MAG TPA: hypothetical protein VEC39_10930 [Vicinamibacterales bacterium]|nr:hypothetical protein [Vicinamibacterales bacterium]
MAKAWFVALAISAAVALTSAQQRIAVGVMTRTGYLLPYFQISGDSIVPLTSNGRMLPAVSALERMPWTLTTIADGLTTEVRATSRQQLDMGYEFRDAWRTTFKGRPWPSYAVPIPKVGLATQGVTAVAAENLVVNNDDGSRGVRAHVTRLAHSRESQFLREEPDHPANKVPLAERRRTVVRLDKLWRRHANGLDTYYFEATKRYGPYVLVVTGWIVGKGDDLTPHFVTLKPADDEHKRGVYRHLLGIIPMEKRELWVMEEHYYEGEGWMIREWPSGKCALDGCN